MIDINEQIFNDYKEISKSNSGIFPFILAVYQKLIEIETKY